MEDIINHPWHYCMGKLEVIDIIEGQNMGYLDGCAIKYICRYRYKDHPIEDLKKARWYLSRLISNLEKEVTNVKEKPVRSCSS